MRRLACITLLCTSCFDATPLVLPPEAEEASAGLIAFVDEEEAQVHAIDLENDLFPPITLGEQPVYLFLYGTDLETLGIEAGRLESQTSTDGRPLPPGPLWLAELPEGAWVETEREALPSPLRDFRIPDLGIGSCERSEGCFRIRDGDEHCQVPCVEPVDAEPAPPAAAAFPEPPVLTPCAEGWAGEPCSPVTIACRFPNGTQYLGDDACSTAGGQCPAGLYREDLPAGTRRYVLGGGSGTGGMGDPFGSIQAAIDASSAGDVIVIGKGTFPAPLSVDREVSLIGACAETIIGNTITVGADATISSLAVVPGQGRRGVAVDSLVVATLSDVVVSSAAIGIEAVGTLRAERVVVEARAGIESYGDLQLDRAIVHGGIDVGVGLYAGAGTITNLRVSSSTAAVSVGLATLQISSAHLATNEVGLAVNDGATVTTNDVLISRSSANGVVVRGGSLTAQKIYLRDNAQSFVQWEGTSTLEHAFFATSAAHHVAARGGTFTLDHAVLTSSRRFGIWATAGRVNLRNVHIRDTLAAVSDGEGIVVDGPVVLEAQKLAIERAYDFGIRVLSTGQVKSELRLDDLTLRQISGYGIEMGRSYAPAARSTLAIHRMLVEDTTLPAVRIVSGEMQEISNLVMRDLPRAGLSTLGGIVVVSKAELSRIDGPSVSVTSGEIRLTDIRILDPYDGLVTEGWEPTDVSAIDAAMNVDRFHISGASEAGVLVRQFSRMTFGAGRILDNRVGVEVRADGFIYSSLEGDVIYRGNVQHNLLKTGQMRE